MGEVFERLLYRAYFRFPWLNPRVAFFRRTPTGANWLDVGSGTGFVVRHLFDLRPDLSAVATDVADFGSHYVGVNGLQFVRLSGFPWPFADASFDIVTSFHVIEHLQPDDLTMFLAELNRVLKPGGRFYLETPSPRSLWLPPIRSPYGPVNFWQDKTHVGIVAPERLQRAGREHGWQFETMKIYRNRAYLLAAPVLFPFAFFPPGNRPFLYLATNLIGWSWYCVGTKTAAELRDRGRTTAPG